MPKRARAASAAATLEHRLEMPPAPGGTRLDLALSQALPQYSRSRLAGWVREGSVWVNGRTARPRDPVYGGEAVLVRAQPAADTSVAPERMKIDVVYRDRHVLVVDKPAGVTMHPAPGNWTGTLLNALVHHVGRVAAVNGRRARPGLVHRLDKGTSGVVVVAKTDRAHRDLSRQFHAHSVDRMYLTLVVGSVKRGGVIDQPIGRDVHVELIRRIMDSATRRVTRRDHEGRHPS